jgi:hypothetical protein
MTQEQRISYWQKLIQAHQESDQSVTDFCQDRQINRQRFYTWRQRFQSQPQSPAGGAFLELIPTSKNRDSGIRLRVDPGLAIEVDRGFDPSTLDQVISIVRSKRPCWP